MNMIKAGTILIEDGALLPKSLTLASDVYSTGWTAVTHLRSEFEREISQAGWTFFFTAGNIQATVFGFNKEKAVHTAVRRIIADVESENCNCLEIARREIEIFPRGAVRHCLRPVAARPRHPGFRRLNGFRQYISNLTGG